MEMPETVEMQPVRTIPIPVAPVEMAAPVSTAAAERSITTEEPLPVEMQEMAAAPKRAMEEPEEMVVPGSIGETNNTNGGTTTGGNGGNGGNSNNGGSNGNGGPVVKVLRERSMEEIRMVITARMVKSSS